MLLPATLKFGKATLQTHPKLCGPPKLYTASDQERHNINFHSEKKLKTCIVISRWFRSLATSKYENHNYTADNSCENVRTKISC